MDLILEFRMGPGFLGGFMSAQLSSEQLFDIQETLSCA